MSKNKKQPLSKPIMIRMDHGMREQIEAIAKANDLSTSDIIRMSVRRQLPALKLGQTKLLSA